MYFMNQNLWYPDFENLSFPIKVIKGYLETNRVLFVTSELNIVFSFPLFAYCGYYC